MKLTSVKLSALSLMALAMTACTSNEEVAMPQPKSNQIGFSVVTNNLTRASNSYCSTNLPAKIKVTSYNNGKNYYGNAFDVVSKSDEDGSQTWKGTTDRYWPRVDDDSWQGLTFFAYVEDDYYENGSETKSSISDKIKLSETNTSSSEATSNADVISPIVKDFTVNSDVFKQIDLMYATTANRKNTGAVPLNFRHALSQVCFKAQNLDPRIKSLDINKIEIHGLTSRGDYQLPVISTLITETPTHNATGVPIGYGANGEWTPSEESDYTNQTFSIENLEISVTCPTKIEGSYNEPDPVNISVPEMTGDNNDQHEAVTETANPYKNALNLIPQVVSPMVTEGDGGAYFKVNVTMKVSEKSDVSESTEEELESLEAQTKDIVIPVDIVWEEGNRYIYTFIWEDNGHVTYQARFADFDDIDKKIISVDDSNSIESDDYIPVKMRGGDNPLYFANKNVGAKTPDDPGLYFWWGDTEGHYYYPNNESNKIYKSDGVTPVTIEGNDYYFGESNEEVTSTYKIGSDNETYSQWVNQTTGNLLPQKDAANVIMQRVWRMPTKEEFEWLIDKNNCEWIWCDGNTEENNTIIEYTFNGKTISQNKYHQTGYFVISKSTGGSIFLPCTAYLDEEDCDWERVEENKYGFHLTGWYWSSTPTEYSSTAYSLYMHIPTEEYPDNYLWSYNDRYHGLTIRGVYTKK